MGSAAKETRDNPCAPEPLVPAKETDTWPGGFSTCLRLRQRSTGVAGAQRGGTEPAQGVGEVTPKGLLKDSKTLSTSPHRSFRQTYDSFRQ